ncbi:hypothetical protein NPIL_32661 [Nephila pilipes]|uniref:Uncharacterized protein n=1 Tax=Nephila pilipes TaxID=299642 RepID=A0A8X6TEA3_NEPPI|nr:hypothetical protein NPIL_32661 [Nephila pilipes]
MCFKHTIFNDVGNPIECVEALPCEIYQTGVLIPCDLNVRKTFAVIFRKMDIKIGLSKLLFAPYCGYDGSRFHPRRPLIRSENQRCKRVPTLDMGPKRVRREVEDKQTKESIRMVPVRSAR